VNACGRQTDTAISASMVLRFAALSECNAVQWIQVPTSHRPHQCSIRLWTICIPIFTRAFFHFEQGHLVYVCDRANNRIQVFRKAAAS
jgi:hypothetical protein